MKGIKLMRSKRLIYVLTLLLILIAIVYFFFYKKDVWNIGSIRMQQLAPWLESLGLFGKTIGVFLVFLQTLFPFVPFVLVAGANVALFGMKWGFVVNYVMSVVASLVGFIAARYFVHAWVEKKLSSKPTIQQFNRKLETQGFLYILLGRLIPVIPSSAINYGAGVTRITLRHFILGTVIGKLPIIYLESLIAHDLFHFQDYKGRLMILVAIFALLILLGSLFKKRLDSRKHTKKVPPRSRQSG
ncbi:TVP38/TMEM64 family protein [Paenibacillus sp. FJAT-26967]|uniref:TVP38/TMEM64 family protein n=1 Tax=Paenibacillus sp. FJAT-26967 TaxID=1729690 RepID=UPI000837BA49|nr:TVP38/TMEM64 family protein [Paenibacillus sp. FJAT-26967]